MKTKRDITYPQAAGYKVDGTSQEAAELAPAKLLREEVFDELKRKPMTADECAEKIGRTAFSVRPRFSELLAAGRIVDTGVRRKNTSGRSAVVWWIPVTPVQPVQKELL